MGCGMLCSGVPSGVGNIICRLHFESGEIGNQVDAIKRDSRLDGRMGQRGDRGKNLAGHVQFYTRRSFEDLITRCGFEIIGSRTYLPVFSVDDLRFIHRKDRMPAWRYPVLWAARRAMPLAAGPLWTRLYYAHQAVLCRPV